MRDFNRIIEEYKTCAILHWNASREGDYKTANKNYTKLSKKYRVFLDSKEIREAVLPQLLNDDSFAVILWAAAHSLGLGKDKDEALLKLEQISKMSANEAPSFEAKMILKVWREKGSLTF